MSDCLFCQIVAGEIPSKPVAQSERAYAFYDIAPQAPVHVLVVSKEHITSADEIASSHGGIIDDMSYWPRRSRRSRASVRTATAWSSTSGATVR